MIALETIIDRDTLVPFSVNNRIFGTVRPSAFEVAERNRLNLNPHDTKIAERKLHLLKRSGLFGGDTRGAVIERACSLEDLRAAYRLVHEVYVSTGFIHPDPSGMRLRVFETSPDTATFVAKVDGCVVGVLSVVGDSPDLGLPSDSAFKGELDVLRSEGFRLCELTNQAVLGAYRKTAVATELMRCAIAHSIKAGFHQSIAAVSPSHDGFYEMVGFRRFGSERSYSEEIYDPVIGMTMDLTHFRRAFSGFTLTEQFLRDFTVESNPYLSLVGEWTRRSRDNFLSVDNLIQLFVEERNFVSECSNAELHAMQFRWGRKLFSTVFSYAQVGGEPDRFSPILSAKVITCMKPSEACEGFTFLSKEIFVRSLTTFRSRSSRTTRRSPGEAPRRTAQSQQ
jgi:ribosomal protein S18 acetylase RimI-like enzyme